MNNIILKGLVVLTALFFTPQLVNAEEISKQELNQINIDKIKASSGIDYILLPNGEKVYAESATYTVYENGIYTFSVFDKLGNSETVDVEITNIDLNSPNLELTKIEDDEFVKIDVRSSDNESGISHIILPDGKRVDSDNCEFNVLTPGKYTFQVYDVAGNMTEKSIVVEDMTLARKTATANVDIYIKCENILNLSLDTNSVTFEDFSGVEDMEKQNAINIKVNSSLAYDINAYMATEIQNSDKTNTMDLNIFNIKENSEDNYQTFTNTNEKIVLKENNSAGNNNTHSIDIRLKGGIAHEKDVYKTTIKIEAVQK